MHNDHHFVGGGGGRGGQLSNFKTEIAKKGTLTQLLCDYC